MPPISQNIFSKKTLGRISVLPASVHIYATLGFFIFLGEFGAWIRDHWLSITRKLWETVIPDFLSLQLQDFEKDYLTAVLFFAPLTMSPTVKRWISSTDSDTITSTISLFLGISCFFIISNHFIIYILRFPLEFGSTTGDIITWLMYYVSWFYAGFIIIMLILLIFILMIMLPIVLASSIIGRFMDSAVVFLSIICLSIFAVIFLAIKYDIFITMYGFWQLCFFSVDNVIHKLTTAQIWYSYVSSVILLFIIGMFAASLSMNNASGTKKASSNEAKEFYFVWFPMIVIGYAVLASFFQFGFLSGISVIICLFIVGFIAVRMPLVLHFIGQNVCLMLLASYLYDGVIFTKNYLETL